MGAAWLLRSLLLATVIYLCLQPPGGAADASGKDSWGWEEEALELVEATSMSSAGTLCVTEQFRMVQAPIRADAFEAARQKVDLAAAFLRDLPSLDTKDLVVSLVKALVESESSVQEARLVILNSSTVLPNIHVCAKRRRPPSPTPELHFCDSRAPLDNNLMVLPWLPDDLTLTSANLTAYSTSPHLFPPHADSDKSFPGRWKFPYYSCEAKKWLMSYSVSLHLGSTLNTRGGSNSALSVDVDLSQMDINQCDPEVDTHGRPISPYISQITVFAGTHKCHRLSTKCVFRPGRGWTRGSYECHCKQGFYGRKKQRVFNGTLVEVAWRDRVTHNSNTYELLFECRRCAFGCPDCMDDSPCLASYNWAFRTTLLVITVLCIITTLIMIACTYSYRRIKVFKVASPIFLCITLVGCSIMYGEMAAIFPVLDKYSCIATKWTRHLGFCITYTALLMKTWRVSLTYRVKSAHKLKLTDKQLLQWMLPIVLVMVIYLGSWTLGAPPHAEYIPDGYGLRFKQCSYNWWDHSLAIGEVLFLCWGIKVCYNVRNAESLYDEARYISWAIYNIAIVNIVMVSIHLFIFPHAGPDIKYLLGFLRTQLSTTVTIAVVFGPKFYRVIKGLGDQYDNRARARGVTASFSLNGIGLVNEETPDLFQENEELKEELQKLAAQIEFMKIVHMEMNNRHLKPKSGSYFSPNSANTVNSNPSPLGKNSAFLKLESGGSEIPSSRLSPAAELLSERV